MEAGVVDWREATSGFEVIAERVAELKLRLAVSSSDDDLSDIGRRCVDIAADVVDVVFRPEMVPSSEVTPSRQDGAARLGCYLRTRIPSGDFEEFRTFAKGAMKLAQSRKHSARTGRAAAIAATQGLLAIVRTIEAIKRTTGS